MTIPLLKDKPSVSTSSPAKADALVHKQTKRAASATSDPQHIETVAATNRRHKGEHVPPRNLERLSEEDLAKAINDGQQQINTGIHSARTHASSALMGALRTGAHLQEARRRCKVSKCKWVDWLKEHCPALPRSTADRYIELAKRFSHVSNPAEITGLRQAYIQTGILPYPPRKKKKTRDQSGIALLERVKSIRSYCGHLNVTKLDGSIPNQLVSEITGLVGDLRKSTVIDVEVQIIPTDETQKVEPKLLDAPKVTPADPAPADAAARDPQPLGDAAAPPLPPSPPQGQSDQLQDTAAAAGNKFADKTPAGAAEPDLQRQGGAGVPPTPPSASLAQAARPEDAATAASTRDKPAVPPPADAAAHGPQPQGASGTPSTPPSLPQPHPAGTEGQAPAVLDKHEREVQPAPAAGAETADQPATDDGGPTASAASNPATPVQPSQTEAPLGKTNDEAPAGSEQVVFLLADGSVHQVPWIHNRMLTFEAIDQHVQSMKSHYENPKTPDPYDQPTLVKFQKALIAAASLAVSVLGVDPTQRDLEIAFHSLSDIRGMLPDPIR